MNYLEIVTNIFSSIVSWDTNMLLKLNSWNNLFFDGFMWITTSILVWLPLYISVIYIIIKKKERINYYIVFFNVSYCISRSVSIIYFKTT